MHWLSLLLGVWLYSELLHFMSFINNKISVILLWPFMLPGLILLFNQKTLNPGVHWTVIACFYQLFTIIIEWKLYKRENPRKQKSKSEKVLGRDVKKAVNLTTNREFISFWIAINFFLSLFHLGKVRVYSSFQFLCHISNFCLYSLGGTLEIWINKCVYI